MLLPRGILDRFNLPKRASRLLRRVGFCFEDGLVAVSVCELVPSSRSSAVPLPSTSSPSSRPTQLKPIESPAYSTSRPASKAPKAISPPRAVSKDRRRDGCFRGQLTRNTHQAAR